MAAVGIVEFLRVFDASDVDRLLWQNYWPGQFVDGYTYMPFSSSGFSANRAGVQEQMTLTMPALPIAFNLAQAGTSSAWLAELSVYQFSISTNTTDPPTSKTLTGRFTGEIVGGSMTLTEITIELGTSLTPTGVVVPARRFTTDLIGAPPKL